MKTYARIDAGLVVELFDTDGDITTMFHPSLVWVDAGTSGAQVGWGYAVGVFSPPSPTPAQTRAQLIAQVLADVRLQRIPVMRTLDGLQSTANSEAVAALIANDAVTAAAKRDTSANIETAKQGLRDATNLDLTPYSTYDEMRLAFKAYYANLVQGASPDVVLAFRASA